MICLDFNFSSQFQTYINRSNQYGNVHLSVDNIVPLPTISSHLEQLSPPPSPRHQFKSLNNIQIKKQKLFNIELIFKPQQFIFRSYGFKILSNWIGRRYHRYVGRKQATHIVAHDHYPHHHHLSKTLQSKHETRPWGRICQPRCNKNQHPNWGGFDQLLAYTMGSIILWDWNCFLG